MCEPNFICTISLITVRRIEKRVEEQFKAFMAGFNELIPQELVNVFDERELELLIGGIGEGKSSTTRLIDSRLT